MKTNPAPFWADLCLYNYEFKNITNLIKTNKDFALLFDLFPNFVS